MVDRSDATPSSAADSYSPQIRTALVLTGTGTAGAYHAGVLRALHEAGSRRVARALRPGGAFVIQEPARAERPGQAGQLPALLGLYFAMQSRPEVRTWTIAEMAGWQRSAGLKVRRAKPLRTAP